MLLHARCIISLTCIYTIDDLYIPVFTLVCHFYWAYRQCRLDLLEPTVKLIIIQIEDGEHFVQIMKAEYPSERQYTAGLMLGQACRQWTNIRTTASQRVVFAVQAVNNHYQCSTFCK